MSYNLKKNSITLGLIVLSIALLVGLILAWNAGLGLPSGYKIAYGVMGDTFGEVAHPFHYYEGFEGLGSYSTKYIRNETTLFLISDQTYETENELSFDYKGEQYFFQDQNLIYNKTDNTLIGSLQDIEKDGFYKCTQNYSFMLLDDNYLYYLSSTYIRRFYFELPTDTGALKNTYVKYEYYRFNLDNGQNEKIDASIYLEKINKYDGSIKLK